MSVESFAGQYQALYERIEAVEPRVRGAHPQLVLLTGEQECLYRQFTAITAIRNSRALLGLDSAVYRMLAKKTMEHMSFLAGR